MLFKEEIKIFKIKNKKEKFDKPKTSLSFLKNSKNKKGVSIMIGYVLLITLAVVMGGVVYTWAKTYVPSEDSIGCDSAISLFVKEISCGIDGDGNISLNLTVKNNGRFDVGGYFLQGTNHTNQTIATIELTGNVSANDEWIISGEQWLMPGIKFPGNLNSLPPGLNYSVEIKIPNANFNNITSIQIIPLRWQELNGKKNMLSCGLSKSKEKVVCVGS